jgi:hypothetical protein
MRDKMVKRKMLIISILFIILIAFFNINITVDIVHESINIFYNFVLPYILPFLFLMQIFINLKGGIFLAYYLQKISFHLLGINGYETVICLSSILCGYPSISIYTESLFKQRKISYESALDLIHFASFPSLFFTLGSLAKYLNNLLYYIFLLSSYKKLIAKARKIWKMIKLKLKIIKNSN